MQKELLSAYIDGEQVSNEFTATLCRDRQLQQSWHNFHAIRSVMREESEFFLGVDFSSKMEKLIEAEANIQISQPMPEETHSSAFMQKLKAMFMPLAQVAVAATVCLVAVFGVQSFNSNQAEKVADTPVLQTLPFNNGVQQVSYNASNKDSVTNEQLEQKNKRLGVMLQEHELQRRIYADNVTLSQQK